MFNLTECNTLSLSAHIKHVRCCIGGKHELEIVLGLKLVKKRGQKTENYSVFCPPRIIGIFAKYLNLSLIFL